MSPRPGPRRPIVGIRIKPEAIAYIDTLAKTEGVNRSEMIRRLLAEAITARQKPAHRASNLKVSVTAEDPQELVRRMKNRRAT